MTRLQELQKKAFYKYNNQKYTIGLSLSEKEVERKVSPYMKLCNLIVGQSDFCQTTK